MTVFSIFMLGIGCGIFMCTMALLFMSIGFSMAKEKYNKKDKENKQ